MADPTPTVPTDLKKILTALDIAAGALVASGQLPGWASQALGALCLVLTYLGYGNTKQQLATLGKAAMVAVLFVGVSFIGCATLKTMTGDFAVCARVDLGQLVKNEEGQIVPLATAVAELIEGNPAALEADALALAGQLGTDAVDCAKVAYEDTHPTTAGSGSAVSAIAPKPGLSRLNAWIAAQRKAGK